MKFFDCCKRLCKPPMFVVAIALLLWIAFEQSRTISHLKANAASAVAALFRENAALKQTSDLWKAEALDYREKHGYEEPPAVPPSVDDSNREMIEPPVDPRP